MSRRLKILVVAIVAALGVGVAVAVAATTGTVSVCSTAHTVAVDGVNVKTIAAQCVTKTYTVPTVSTTVTSPPVTTTVTQTVTSTPTTSTTTSSTTTTAPPAGQVVGAASDPTPTCAASVATAGALDAALASAPAGSIVCLKAGTTFPDISFDVASTKAVTVDAQGDTTGEIDIDQQISNLTLSGFNSKGFWVNDPLSNLTIQHNTVSHVAKGEGVVLRSTAHGQSGAISNTTIRYNQFDHLGECLGDTGESPTVSFTHNLCGPGLGYGDTASTDPGHYIQTGGDTNWTIDNNAFVGPADPAANSSGIHLNVFHLDGTSNHVEFSHNLLWHDGAVGQSILGQEGLFDNVHVDNNVAVENGTGDSQHAYTFWLGATHTGSFNNNTTVGSYYGNLVTESQTGQYATSTGFTATGNLTTGTVPAGGNNDCGYGNGATASGNYSGDDCSGLVFNGAWQNTTWTPPTPYAAPPAGWYQPNGLSGVGYQGSVGP